jgi:hypothetical protein
LRRLVTVSLLTAAACSFEPAGLTGGPSDARVDGPTDAGAIDAPVPDAAPDQCPEPSLDVALGQSVGGTVTGISRYANPTCPGGGDSGESFVRVEVSGANGHDLVVDVTEPATGGNDSQIDISVDCTPSGSVLPSCVDVAPRGHGDVAVVPNAENRRYYVIVDAFGTSSGAFDVTPFLRPVVVIGQPCAVDLRGARCGTGACATTPDTKVASCQAIPPVAELESTNDSRCSTPHLATDDFVLTGEVDDIFDDDWIEVRPATAKRIRAVLHGPDGGCAVDARLGLYSGNSCPGAAEVLVDHDSGLGACPVLVTPTALDPAGQHFLRVELDDGAPLAAGGAPYTLVIDFIDE